MRSPDNMNRHTFRPSGGWPSIHMPSILPHARRRPTGSLGFLRLDVDVVVNSTAPFCFVCMYACFYFVRHRHNLRRPIFRATKRPQMPTIIVISLINASSQKCRLQSRKNWSFLVWAASANRPTVQQTPWDGKSCRMGWDRGKDEERCDGRQCTVYSHSAIAQRNKQSTENVYTACEREKKLASASTTITKQANEELLCILGCLGAV